MAVYGGKYMGTSYMRGRSLRFLRFLLFYFSLASQTVQLGRQVVPHQRLAPGRIIRTKPSTNFSS